VKAGTYAECNEADMLVKRLRSLAMIRIQGQQFLVGEDSANGLGERFHRQEKSDYSA